MLKQIRQIEKNITVKMKQIKKGEISISESRIGIQFNRLKEMDEASYEKYLKDYNNLTKTLV